MPQLVLNIVQTLNLQSIFTVNSLKDNYLSGLPLPSSITDEVLEFHIESSIVELENYLSLRFRKQLIKESKDFYTSDWVQWGFIPTTYPVVCPVLLEGYLNQSKQVTYKREWMSSKRTNDGRWYSRLLNLIPSSTVQNGATYTGYIPLMNFFNSRTIPNYWEISYVTGWDVLPKDIENAIGMLSAMKVLQIISDALMIGSMKKTVDSNGQLVLSNNGTSLGGLGFGVSNKSISIDGLSQSYSTYINGQTGAWGARMKQYGDMLDSSKQGTLLNRLYEQYTAINFGVC